MTAKSLRGALICISLLMAGCRPHYKTEMIAELRKSGEPTAARTRAVEALTKDPNQLDIWRELAATDVDLARRAMEVKENPRQPLLEAALICAAVGSHGKGRFDREWNAVGMVVASELGNYGGNVTNELNYPNVGPTDTEEEESGRFLDEDRDDEERLPPPIIRQAPPEGYVDPQFLGDIIYQTVLVMELLKQLPYENPKVLALTLNQLDQRLNWSAGKASISRSFVNIKRESAAKVAREGVSEAVSDLDVQGYFYTATILNNKILE